ncbi:centriole, cilia and spindle-associated protein isoform X2 [Anolis carolinensis]|uniref:centriole, cilia and spindle-associated protein isoform X2 n=1 Tax=Anolis carolinensis TaxID=28377 RepID=UPI002F2B3E92
MEYCVRATYICGDGATFCCSDQSYTFSVSRKNGRATEKIQDGSNWITFYGCPVKKEEEQEKTEADRTSAAKITDKSTGQQQGPPASRSAVGARGDRRRAKSPQRTETTKELRHPFALYGWGEKQTDTGNQKTHNVCASASQNEIHESALRAKNRRQVEKRKMPQRQIRSADVEKTWRMKSSGADNPWMTEYMRCYSARTR